MPPLTLDGTNGVSAVQAGAVESGDLPAGSVLQVVQGTNNQYFVTNSTSYVATPISASITPSSVNSKILIFCNFHHDDDQGKSTTTIFRDSVNIVPSGTREDAFTFLDIKSNSRIIMPISSSFLDSPSTTSTVTYEVAIRTDSAIYAEVRGDIVLEVITLMEIAG